MRPSCLPLQASMVRCRTHLKIGDFVDGTVSSGWHTITSTVVEGTVTRVPTSISLIDRSTAATDRHSTPKNTVRPTNDDQSQEESL